MTRMTRLAVLIISFALFTPSVFAQVGVNLGAHASTSSKGTFKVNTDGSIGAKVQHESSGLTTNALGAEVRASSDVQTEEDLDAYEENLLVVNSAVKDADSSNKRVGVSYWHEGKFLGLFKVKVEARTDAVIGEEDTLTVTTNMPWWAFLVFGLGDVRGDVQYEIMSHDEFSAQVLDRENAVARARAIETIVTAHAKVAGNK